MNATQVLQTRKQRYKNQTNVVPTLIPKLAFPFLLSATQKNAALFLKIHLKIIKNLMKIIIKTTLWRSLGGSWSHLGLKNPFWTSFWSYLGYFGRLLGPFWAPFGLNMRYKVLKESPKRAKRVPRELP